MGRPLTNDDIEALEIHMQEMKKLTKTQVFFVVAPSIVFTSWILYQYFYAINYHM